MVFSLHLVLFFLRFLSCLATKTNFAVCHKVTGSLKGGCPFHPNTTLSPSQQISAAATITHFNVLFNSNCSPHSQILVCSTFAPFCFLDFSVQACRQLCLVVKSSSIHLFILNNIQWPAALTVLLFHRLLKSVFHRRFHHRLLQVPLQVLSPPIRSLRFHFLLHLHCQCHLQIKALPSSHQHQHFHHRTEF